MELKQSSIEMRNQVAGVNDPTALDAVIVTVTNVNGQSALAVVLADELPGSRPWAAVF